MEDRNSQTGHKMKVEFVSKQTIKPSSPTPQNLETFKLSFFDQIATAKHNQILFFFVEVESEGNISERKVADDRYERLKTSLSETLTYFYPLAGRVKDNAIIECKDEGAEFCEARVYGFLVQILKQPDNDTIRQFVPDDDDAELENGFLLKVQVNLFDCGGLIIGVSLSHKITDASTIASFIKAWSSMSAGCTTESMIPKYCLASLYPSMDFPTVQSPFELGDLNCITKRFVFDSSKITELKAKAASKMVEKPTRVEAVLALIWKCATAGSRANLGITNRTSKVGLAVNLRKRLSPPLPETCVGNFVSGFTAEQEETNESTDDIDLQMLVFRLRKGQEQFSKERLPKLQDKNSAFSSMSETCKEIYQLVSKEDIDFYVCTSWCNCGFYEADFGWGKPKWAMGFPSIKIRNLIILMDTSEGKGIEAWVTLSSQDMALVETNHEMLEFSSLNPSII